METNLLICGIPAGEWIGRRVRFWGHENKQHPTPCLVMGIDNTRVIIKPIGHKKNEMVEADKIAPTWKNNDDLRQKYAAQLNGHMVEDQPDDVVPPPEAWEEQQAEIESDLRTTLQEQAFVAVPAAVKVAVPPQVIKQPRMVITDHSADWMPTYQLYLGALKAEAGDRAMLEELNQAIAAHADRQRELIRELGTFGVQIIDEEVPAIVQHVQQRQAEDLRKQPRKNRGRIAMDKHILNWGTKVRDRLEAGESVVGTINAWSTELGIGWETFAARLGLLEKVFKLDFNGVTSGAGRGHRGIITVTLKLK